MEDNNDQTVKTLCDNCYDLFIKMAMLEMTDAEAEKYFEIWAEKSAAEGSIISLSLTAMSEAIQKNMNDTRLSEDTKTFNRVIQLAEMAKKKILNEMQ